jgi:GTP cyclohydrolase I
MNKKLIEEGTRLILEGLIGPEWEQDENYEGTPRRVAKMYAELFCDRDYTIPVFTAQASQMILMRHHREWTFCPHHLLPVQLEVSVAYIPHKRVVGVSKLARIVQNHLTEPLLQETLTDSIADEVSKRLKSMGAAVQIIGIHDCMRIRGVKTAGEIVTSALRGVFLEKPEVREEFFELVRR